MRMRGNDSRKDFARKAEANNKTSVRWKREVYKRMSTHIKARRWITREISGRQEDKRCLSLEKEKLFQLQTDWLAGCASVDPPACCFTSVSYTHLTLPTMAVV